MESNESHFRWIASWVAKVQQEGEVLYLIVLIFADHAGQRGGRSLGPGISLTFGLIHELKSISK